MHEQFNPIREVYSIVLHVWPTTTKKYLVSSISFVSFLLFILLQTTSHAQKAYSPTIADPVADAWRWHAYKQVEGKKYNCMLEDQSGNIWIGHRTGLYRYNGLDWQTFPAIDTLNISVTALFETEEGDILAGSETAIYQFDNEIWTKIFDLSIFEKTRCAALGQSPDGAIWIGLDDGAIRLTKSKPIFYTRNRNFSTDTRITSQLDVVQMLDVVWPKGDFTDLEDEKVEISETWFFYTDSKKHFWFSMGQGALIESTIENATYSFHIHFTADNLCNFIPHAITETLNGEIWVVYNNSRSGISIYNGKSWRRLDLFEQGGTNINTSIIQTPDSIIWLGGFKTLQQIKNDKLYYYRNPTAPVPSSRLHIMYSPRSTSVWIAGIEADLLRFNYGAMHYTSFIGLNFQCEDTLGRQWFIAHNGAAVFFDRHKNTWGQYTQDNGVIQALVRIVLTKNGQLIGYGSHQQDAAICVFRDNAWQKKVIKGLMWGIIERSFYEASDGRMWFGAATPRNEAKGWLGGMAVFDPHKGDILADEPWEIVRFPIEGVCHFGEMAPGKYIAGWKNIFYFIDGKKTAITDVPEQGSTLMEHIIANGDGEFWGATRGSGVYHVKNNVFTAHTIDQGLVSNNTGWVLPAYDKTVWVGTPKGISRYDGRQWIDLVLPTEINIEPQYGSVLQSRDSCIWVNNTFWTWTKRAYTEKDPGDFDSFKTFRYRHDSKAPETKITLFEKEISQPGNAIFEWKGTDIWQETDSKNLQYSYRLDQGEWSLYTLETRKIFLSLTEGDHTLEVKARDLDFNEDQTPAKVSFTVTPPVYKTWWFISLISGFLLSIILFFVQLKVHSRKQALFITELEEQKDEIQQQSEEISSQRDQLEVQVQKIEVQNENLNILSIFGQKITATFDLKSINSLIYELLSQKFNVSAIGIGLFHTNTKKIEFIYFIENGMLIPPFYNFVDQPNSLAATCVRSGNEIIINDFDKDAEQYITGKLDAKTKTKNLSLVYLPLKSKDEIIGVLSIQSKDIYAFTSSDLNNFRVISSYVAIALDNSSAYSVINQQKEHVYSSIKYAQTIQNAILPTNAQIGKLFNFFNVYKPKDIVSGDFYWMSEDKNEHEEFFFVMADCTGHGVPGAFMSVIGSQLLSRIINERKVYSPANILEELDINLRTVLMQEESHNNDGMDIMVCKFRKTNINEYLVTFAGAKSACIEYQSKTKSCIVHKGTSRKIGGARRSKQNLVFEEQHISLSENDYIIMYTDGIIDLAYANRKRFGTNNLIEFLISIHELTVQEKERSFNDLINNFLKVSNQRDDIAIIGLNPFV